MATTKGHLNQKWKNFRSIKPLLDITSNFFPAVSTQQSNFVFVAFLKINLDKKNVYTNLTAKFLIILMDSNMYISVLYHYDINSMLAETMEN